MRKYEHVFFDLDRTLWDFETNSHEALTEIHFDFGLRDIGIEDAEAFIGRYKKINEHFWALYRMNQIEKEELRTIRFQKTLAHFGVDDHGLAKRVGECYLEITPRKSALLPNAIQILEILKDDHELHIITNGFEEVQEIKLKHSGLDGYFGSVVTSEQVGHKKPDPRVFQFSLDSANATKDASIMVGDDLLADIVGARDFGMDQVYYNPGRVRHDESVMAEINDLLELTEILS